LQCSFCLSTKKQIIFTPFDFIYYSRLKSVRNGGTENEAKQPVVRKKSLAYDLAVEWFQNFSRNADNLPNSSSRPLPACLSKRGVYSICKEEMGSKPILSRSHFLQDVEDQLSRGLYS